MLLSLVIGIPMGLLMGRFKNRWPDKIGTAIIVLIQAVPAAVYYLYIQMYGTTALGVGLLFDASDWRYWVLPVCSMSLGNVASTPCGCAATWWTRATRITSGWRWPRA